MKITDVRTIPLRGATHDTGWPGGTDPNEQMNTLLEIRTDEGLTGIGSCFTSLPFVEASLTHLKPMLLGETVFEAERVSEKLRQLSFWYGRGGAVEHTISGLDIALWDLMGKALNQPVSRLLGGNYRDRIKPYASILFEEALKPDDLAGFKELRQTSPVKIAPGEVFTRRQTFQPFITQRALDIIQPDLTKCGGLSEGRRMAWLAYDHGVLLVPHGWNTAIGVAADLALTAAMPVAGWVEYQTGVPYVEELIEPRFQLDKDGMLPIPTGPGLGVTLNPDAVAKFSRG